MGTGIKAKIKLVFRTIIGLTAVMIIVLVFGGTGFGVYYWVLKPPMDAENILKNGVETTATIISLNSNVTKDKEPYYSLKLSFHNSEGEEITVKTSSLYSQNFIRQHKIAEYDRDTRMYNKVIKDKDKVKVRYIGKNAVLRSYVPDKTDKVFWAFPIVFGSIGLGFLIAIVYGIISSMMNIIIKIFGAPGIGRYLRHSLNPIAGVSRYIIYYTFENKSGKLVEGKVSYTNQAIEAEALIEMKSFPIKYIGKKALIMLGENELPQLQTKKNMYYI